MEKYYCVAYGDNEADKRFVVRADSDEQAVIDATAEVTLLGKSSLFVEDATGRQVFDGLVVHNEPKL